VALSDLSVTIYTALAIVMLGVTDEGRHVFAVFMLRKIGEKTYIRPISSRYMHQKEVDDYEAAIT
jgi:uncharacterized DUF497 family protein